jgi:hypothetical protein
MAKKTVRKLTSFDRPACRLIRERLEAILKPLAEELGVAITLGNARFSETTVNFKTEVAIIGENGAETKSVRDFRRMAPVYGMKEEHLGLEFAFNGDTFKITGAQPSSRKYPILAQKIGTTKTFKFPSATVLFALAAKG